MTSEHDPLEEISVKAAKVIRDRLKESHEAVVKAQSLVDGVRKTSVVPDGTRECLKTLSAKLGEAEDMYAAKVFASITRNYGDDPDEAPTVTAMPTVTAARETITEETGS